MAILGRWSGGVIGSMQPSTSWAAPNGLFPTETRNDSSTYSFTSSTSTVTLPSSGLPDGYMLRATVEFEDSSNGRMTLAGRFTQASGTGNIVTMQSGGYNRNTSEDRSYIQTVAVVDNPSASATFQFEWIRDSDAPGATDGTVRSTFDIIPLYYSNIGMYTGDTVALESGTTPNVVALTATAIESDTAAISRTTNTVTVKGDNKRYLVIGGQFRFGQGNTRTARNITMQYDSTPDYSVSTNFMLRDNNNDVNGGHVWDIIETFTSDVTVELTCWGTGTAAAYQPLAEQASTTTLQVSQLNSLIVIELNDSADVIRGHESTLALGSGTNTQDISGTTPVTLNVIQSKDFYDVASFNRVSGTTVITALQDMDSFFGANVFTARATTTNSSRHTGTSWFEVDGTPDTNTEAGNYSRGDESTSGSFGGGVQPGGFIALSTNEDVTVSYARISGGEAGNPVTIGLSVFAINLDTLETAAAGEDVLTADDLDSASQLGGSAVVPVARLDTAVGTSTNSTSYPVSAGTNRCLIVITQGEENNATAGVPTATFGGISMTHVVGAHQGGGATDDTRGDVFFLNDAGIASATGSVITLSNLPSDGSTFHYHSYENVVQTTPTVTDTHAAGSGHATLTITSVDNGAVVCLAANGTAPNSATWTGGVTEQTDLVVGAISHGSTADELTETGAAESYTGTFGTEGNRAVGIAVVLAPLPSQPAIGQAHVLTADDLNSVSQLSTPDITQENSLLADDLNSVSQVSSPAIAEVGQEHDLLADDLQSASEVSTPLVFSDPFRLFPIGDTTVDGWTDELFGTTTIYTSIDEYTANDSDYIRSSSPPTADIYKCILANVLPKPDSDKDQKVMYRYGKSIVDSNNAVDLTVKLIEGASTVIASWSHTNVGTTLTTVEQVLTTPQKTSITDYDDLFLQFEAYTQ